MTVDFAFPPPEPAPVTTIAWRLAHLVVGVFGARVASHFGGPPCSYESFDYAATAAEAMHQLDSGYAAWLAGVRGWQEEDSLALPCGPAERPWDRQPRGALVLHINREVIHHGAETALLRDLWATTPTDTPHATPRSDHARNTPTRGHRTRGARRLPASAARRPAQRRLRLTDEQAHAVPSRSAISIAGVLKHVAFTERVWLERARAGASGLPADDRPTSVRAEEYGRDWDPEGQTIEELLAVFDEQTAATEAAALDETLDLDAPVPVPRDAPWFPKDIDAWSVRWVLFHILEEAARHAGHADLVREHLDGATMYELLAGVEGWPETPWLKPWHPSAATPQG